MKRRIVSLLTAMIMLMTIFAVPTVSAAETDAVEQTAVTAETVAADLNTNENTEVTEDVTEGSGEVTEPSEPETPAEPEVPAEPAALEGAAVKIAQASYEFTKKQVKPEVTVTLNGETLVKDTDYTVEYSNNIYPGTAKITVTGINNYKGSVSKTFGIATPKNLLWKKSTTDSIKLDWNDSKNVTGYKVYRYNFSKGKWVFVKNTTSSETTVKNLIPGTDYQFRVRAYYKDGDTTYLSPVSAVNKIPTKPNKVVLKNVLNHPALYAKLTWGKRNSTGYQVQYSRYASFKDAKIVKVASATKLSKKITDLKDNQQYFVRVRAYRTYGNKTTYGDWSKSKAFATNGTRWYKVNGRQYYYEDGKKVMGNKMFGKHQYFFNYEDGAWSGASAKMWNKVKDSSSKTDYLISVSRELNRLCVYEGEKGNWKLKYYWMCSTGRPEDGKISITPTGSWLMPEEDNHLGYIGGHKDYTCWYATRFYKRCFFHSVTYQPESKTDKLDPRLGMNISDGCIRLDIENAKWIYDNCHTGTRVIVY